MPSCYLKLLTEWISFFSWFFFFLYLGYVWAIWNVRHIKLYHGHLCLFWELCGEKEPSCLDSSEPDFAPNWGEGKGEGLTKREGCRRRSGPGCRLLLCACPRAGKCQEPVLQRSWMGGLVGKPSLLIRSCMLLKGLNRRMWFHFPFPYHMPQKKKITYLGSW